MQDYRNGVVLVRIRLDTVVTLLPNEWSSFHKLHTGILGADQSDSPVVVFCRVFNNFQILSGCVPVLLICRGVLQARYYICAGKF